MVDEPKPEGVLPPLAGPIDALQHVPLAVLARALRARLPALPAGELPFGAGDELGALSIELETGLDLFANRFSRRRAAELFAMAGWLRDAGAGCTAGATVVELGCGSVNPLGALLVHVLAGAARAIGVDLDPPRHLPSAVRALARIATYMLAQPSLLAPATDLTRADVARHFAGFDLVRLWQGDPGGIDESRLQLRCAAAERTGIATASVDFAYSVSFLEHVRDPATVVAELARITRPGGCGAHTIDGKDHAAYADPGRHPLAFLAAPDGAAIVHGSNRVRPMQFVALFERGGFDVVRFVPHERVDVPAGLRATFAPAFRELDAEVLAVAGGAVVVRRRDDAGQPAP